MANRYLRGTFVRNAWDFYEMGAAFVYGAYTAPAGIVGFIFNNNGIAQTYIDVYRVEVTAGVAGTIVYSIVPPGMPHDSIEPTLYFNKPVQIDLGQPPGDMSVYTTPPGWFLPPLKSRQDATGYDLLELRNGGPFLTLPPLFGLAVGFNLSAPATIAMSVWYQSLTDHTAPAS